jgi:DNA-directed RNA polymerase subunit RPC12/RpoP
MSSDADVTCGQCGAILDVDPASSAATDRTPCPNCGSTSRGVVIHPRTIEGKVELSGSVGTAKRSAAHGEITFSANSSGVVTGVDETAPPLTILGQEVVHRCELVICKPNDEGVATFAVLDDQGEVVALGYGDSVDDAMPDLMLSMLPPDHPDFDAGPREP